MKREIVYWLKRGTPTTQPPQAHHYTRSHVCIEGGTVTFCGKTIGASPRRTPESELTAEAAACIDCPTCQRGIG